MQSLSYVNFSKNKDSDFFFQIREYQYFFSTKCSEMGHNARKTCLRGFANNTDADQPAHPRSLISAFVIRFLESIICKLATGEISTF